MLHLYRRHRKSCSHTAESYRRCQCPIYVKGTLGGTYTRMSLDQTSWDAASTIVASWVNVGRIGAVVEGEKTVGDAVADFMVDAKDRGLTAGTLKKYRLLLGRLVEYATTTASPHIIALAGITLDDLSKFRQTWPGAALTRYKHQERLRAFFTWCQRRDWISSNPAEGLSTIKVTANPTLPFTEEEMTRILDACDRYPTLNRFGYDNRLRMKAMVLLLRWSGLRIQDAVTLERDRIKNGQLFLYTQKTGTPVMLPLPSECTTALEGIHKDNRYIFWTTGNGTPESLVSTWGRSLRHLFRLANVTHGHPHRFRDTFAVGLLLNGVDLLDVSILLGHSSIRVTERHYAPFVAARSSRLQLSVRSSWSGSATSPAPEESHTPAAQPTPESAMSDPA